MARDDTIDILLKVPTLSLLEQDALRLLAFAAQRLDCGTGDVLFRRGTPSAGAYLVHSGLILLGTSGSGLPDAEAGAGTLIDELAMFVEMEHDTDAIARRPSEVVHLSRELMRRVLHEYPASAVSMRDGLARRLDALSRDIASVGERLQSL